MDIRDFQLVLTYLVCFGVKRTLRQLTLGRDSWTLVRDTQ